MKNILSLMLCTFIILSCSKSKIIPVSEMIKKIWVANIVKENNVIVYTQGSTSNIRAGYSKFVLNCSSNTVSLTEFDGTVFIGQWEISNDERNLILKNLIPNPTGTNGTLEFSINSISETQLSISRTTANQKTGNTMAVYELKIQ